MIIVHRLFNHPVVRTALVLTLGSVAISALPQHSLTPGQFAVNDAGAATYGIPISVAPGVGGLSPKLTLQYSSQAPNGVFGVGWTLSGVSSITRCAKTTAEDGDRVGVQNNATDLFCLDGQKLRVVNGLAYGAAGAQYRTSIDTYGRITSQGNVAGGPQYFTLEAKTGEIYTFGGTDASRLEHPSKGVVRTWMVSEIKDRYNNRISFSYSKNLTLGEQLLTSVDYSNGRVQLDYEARPENDRILKFDDGVEYGSTNSRVSAITVAHSPVISGSPTITTFKTYQLQYTQSQASQRSMLRSIKECAPDGSCLPATTLNYRDGVPGSFRDVGAAPAISTPNGLRDTEGNGKQSVYNFRTPPYYEDVALWDVDGDGRTDLLTKKLQLNEQSTPTQEIIEYANGTKTSRTWDYQNHIRCFADINGDGISESIRFVSKFVGGSNSGTTVYSVSETFGNTSILLGNNVPVSCHSIDIDGDGRAEVFVSMYSGSPINLTHKNGAFSTLPYTPEFNYTSIKFGDFNGDGKTDTVRSSSFAGPAASTYLSSGSGLNGRTAWSTAVGGIACTGDFNGDGRTDILGGRNQLFLSNGSSATIVSQNVVSYTGSFSSNICGDFNGDGLMDIVSGQRYWYNQLPADVDRLEAVDNGAGFIQRVEYKPITDNSVYTKGVGAAYPQTEMQTPIIVVSRVQSGNDSQKWQNTSYRYAALRADLRRSGTQGFERVTSVNEGTGVSVATHYHQNFPLTGLRSRMHKYVGSEIAPHSLEDTTFGYMTRTLAALPAHQAAQVHLNQITTTFYDLKQLGVKTGTLKESTEEFDSFGFPTTQKTERLDGNGVLTSSTQQSHTYSHQEATWLLGQLTRTTTAAQNHRTLPATAPPPSPLTVQLNTTEVVANPTGPGLWSGTLSVTAQGATPPYSYAWTRMTGNRTAFSNAGVASPTISATLAAGEEFEETLRVTVTDANGVSDSREVVVRYVTPFPFTSTITANTSNYNLRAAAVAAGWNQTSQLRAVVTINAGVMVSANTVSAYAFDTGAGFPAGSTLALINNGSIIGMGGAGGAGGMFGAQGAPGQAGGPALRAQSPLVLTNNGTIASGGNGGAGGAGWTRSTSRADMYMSGARGGGGRSGATNSAGGNPGTAAAPGAASSPTGAPASATSQPGGQYGGGAAVVGNGNVEWQTTGSRLGALN